MPYRYSHEEGGPFLGNADDQRQAAEQAWATYGPELDVFVARVTELGYHDFVDLPEQILSDWKERMAETGQDTSYFDALEDYEKQVLGNLLIKGVQNWEAWLAKRERGDEKICAAVTIDAVKRFRSEA